MPPKTNLKVHVHVLEKTIVVSCGAGSQRLRWLGIVGLARWDESEFQGWRYLGVPEKIVYEGTEMDMGATIRDVLTDGAEITVIPSIHDYDEKAAVKSKR
ncbi:hypothetical protein TrVE_jg3099 [Triparma verrucosa]|uniref:Uncharacterized protein n=2 Tax=Triparma TaxID=722752 RepID=A0A9W7AY90_9STRA|nr:hypothetical protein TrST_g7809 [Triparma strigata]GMH81719.1 hypothetical protein TrVE_jg3099 [Triparma verrucosa]